MHMINSVVFLITSRL